VETGLGVALINAQRNVQTERVWGVAVVATAVAGLGYLLISLVGRTLTSWAPKEQGR
jgi:ABC-type nitrate/sulfonate/bicarbonate transport system permease component